MADPSSPLTPRPLLDSISSPSDIAELQVADLCRLANEIREELLDVISKRGGHLASNLGVVELTIALLRAFTPPADKVIWDTGHQGYVYKLLTGRRELFQSLRQDDGCCGFLHRDESPYDQFGAGHAGTAISAALGFAAARDACGGKEKVVAVVGDGAIGNGISLEGLNNIVESTHDFVLILNDNKMSIAPNVGALSRYFNKIISGRSYNQFKAFMAETVDGIPGIGHSLRRWIRRVEEGVKSVVVPGGLFEDFGLRYIGPIDGHDLSELVETLERVSSLSEPILIHVLTEKGHGYKFAQEQPESFHGASCFDTLSGQPIKAADRDEPEGPTFSVAFGESLASLMAENPKVVGITAGMCKGTGLNPVRQSFPERYFDVGIAEEHAAVFAAGLAAAGMQPVVAVYATFMHRAVDCVLHDVCLQDLPVIFCLDRAGIVQDGPTHHGIHDLAFWQAMPGLQVLQPVDADELKRMMDMAVDKALPCIIRYSKGDASPVSACSEPELVWGRAAVLRRGPDVAIWCLGRECVRGMEAANLLSEDGIEATVVNTRFFNPFDSELLSELSGQMPTVTLEDHSLRGGVGSIIRRRLAEAGNAKILTLGWPEDRFVPHGSDEGLRSKFGLSVASIAERIGVFVRSHEDKHYGTDVKNQEAC